MHAVLPRGLELDVHCVLRFRFRSKSRNAHRCRCRGGRIDHGCIPLWDFGWSGWGDGPRGERLRIGRWQCDGICICPLRCRRMLVGTLHSLLNIRLGLRPRWTRRGRNRRKELCVGNDVLGRHCAVKAVRRGKRLNEFGGRGNSIKRDASSRGMSRPVELER